MAKHTIQTKILAALEAEGYRENKRMVNAIAMAKPGQARMFFVGVAGALRAGETRTASVSVSEAKRQQLIAAGEALLADGQAPDTKRQKVKRYDPRPSWLR